MATTYEFYEQRANAAAEAAAKATLANVRERELRAERTWRDLANQARGVAKQREKIDRQKAEERQRAAEAQEDVAPVAIAD